MVAGHVPVDSSERTGAVSARRPSTLDSSLRTQPSLLIHKQLGLETHRDSQCQPQYSTYGPHWLCMARVSSAVVRACSPQWGPPAARVRSVPLTTHRPLRACPSWGSRSPRPPTTWRCRRTRSTRCGTRSGAPPSSAPPAGSTAAAPARPTAREPPRRSRRWCGGVARRGRAGRGGDGGDEQRGGHGHARGKHQRRAHDWERGGVVVGARFEIVARRRRRARHATGATTAPGLRQALAAAGPGPPAAPRSVGMINAGQGRAGRQAGNTLQREVSLHVRWTSTPLRTPASPG